MNKLLEKIYDNGPVFLQNIMTSLYGYQLHRQRYGGLNRSYSELIRKSEFASKEDIKSLQDKKLIELVRHAYSNVPYYKEKFDSLNIDINAITGIENLKELPLTGKDEIRKNPEMFVARNIEKQSLFRLNTSGTTGKPLTIFCDKDSRRRYYAFFNRLRDTYKVRMGDRRATFGGRIIVPQTQKEPPFWRYDISENNYLFSSYHMSPDTLMAYYKQLVKVNPVEIRGYPSSIYSMAYFMRENNLSGIRPKLIVTTAETLLDYARKCIEDVFGCPVTDTYGCTEMAFYVNQCEAGRYHVNADFGIVEVLKDGKPVGPGVEGELVCTGFINHAMPLLRYRVGDTVALSESGCQCGRQFPVVDRIVGRTDDIIITPDKRRIGRLDPIFKGGSGIKETQIIQTDLDRIVLKMVKGRDFTDSSAEFVISELKKRVGDQMTIEIEYLDEIPKQANGKFRSVISHVAVE